MGSGGEFIVRGVVDAVGKDSDEVACWGLYNIGAGGEIGTVVGGPSKGV